MDQIRRPFCQNKQASDILLRDFKSRKKNPPTDVETLVVQKLFDLYQNDDNFKMIKYLHVMSVKEVPIKETSDRALLLTIPNIEMKDYRNFQISLCQILEAEFNCHIFLLQHRRILPREKPGKRLQKQKRPRSRTVQAVHEGYLEDLVWPHRVSAKYEIHDVGIEKPTHHFMLEINSKPDTESKLEVYKQVYSHLTGKTCVFEYLDYTEGTELQRQMCPNIWPCDASAFPSYREKLGNQMQEFSEIKPAPLFAETSNNERNAIEVNQE
ncbi:small subunit ribosomal protein S7e_2, cytoplasmic type [Guillardia theta CCMP2712]|nr:small subunit ribosomal protein S7e_2, cytoplasmic type [Guillardia theta CCMP2712]EKX37172.1 small subunit ribosomal protein S7e_2, cytoplasmic type [Guillardia theta CCMP2712]|eukprot:XP_005824152.1 small subunit ribosomal protein S7e_2, cytoplasmic type [Guillardia theta CCMP2712]